MRSCFSAAVGIGILLGTVASFALGRLQSSSTETARAEVRAAWDEYVKAVSAQRSDVIADRVYLAPSFNLAPSGVIVSNTAAEVRSRFEANWKQLTSQNYDHSETKSANICVLNETAAILSAQFVRYRKDGSILNEPAGTYVFAKTPQGWRIVAQMGHAPERIIRCAI